MSAPPPAPARRRRRWPIVLAVLAVMAVILAIAAASFLTPERLTPFVVGILDETLEGKFAIDRVEWAPPFGVRAERFVVTATTGRVVLEVDHVEGSAAPLALLDRHIVVTEARLRGARLRMARRSAEAAFDLVAALQPKPTPGPPTKIWLTIDRARIEDVSVELDDPRARVIVRGATVTTGRLVLDPDDVVIDADVEAPRARLELPDRPAVDLSAEARGVRFTWAFAAASGHLEIEDVRFQSTDEAPIHGRASGEIEHLASVIPMTTDATIEITVPMRHPLVLDALPPGIFATTGTAAIVAHAKGPLLGPSVTATLTAEGIVAKERALGAIRAVGRANPMGIEVDRFDVALGEGSARGRATVDLIRGRWSADGILSRAPARVLAAPSMEDTSLLPEAVDGPVHVEGAIGGDNTTIDATITGGGLALEAQGEVGPGPFDLALHLRHRALGPIFRRFLPGASAPSAELVGRLRGTPERPRLSGVLTARSLRYPGLPLADVRAPFELDGAALGLSAATVTSSIGGVATTGRVLLPMLEREKAATVLGLDFDSTRLELAAFTGGKVHGRAQLRGRLEGTSTKPEGKVEIDLGRLDIAGVVTQPSRLTLSADDGRYALAPARIELARGGSVELRGSTDLQTVDARLVGEALPLALLTATSTRVAQAIATSTTPGGVALDGAIDVVVIASGPLRAPRIAAEIEGRRLLIAGASFSRLTARAEGPSEALVVEALAVGLGGTVRVEATVDAIARTVRGELLVRGLDIPQVPDLPPERNVDGRLDAELVVDGALPYPSVRGRLALRQITYAGKPVGDELITVDVAPGARIGDYRLELDVGRGLHARISVGLLPELAVVAQVTARELSLGPFVPQLSDSAVDALVTATATVTYSARRGVVADAVLGALVVAAEGLALELTTPAPLTYARGKAEIGRLRLEGVRGWLEIGGSYDDELDLRASASINAAILPALARGIQQATGRFRVDAAIRGTTEAPAIEATLALEERVTLRPRAGAVREIVLDEASLRVTPRGVLIQALSGRMAGGAFRLRGSAGLDGLELTTLALAFDATSLPIRTGDLAVEANVSLRLDGELDAMRLSGGVEVVRARYQKQFRLQNFAFVSAKTDAGPTLGETMPWLANLELDLRVTSPGDIQVVIDATALQVELELAADVLVRGTPIEPRLDGRVTSDAGRLRFPKADLDVRAVTVDLDPFPTDGRSGVYVRLVAEGEVVAADALDRSSQARVVTLVLSGPIEEMQLDLQSAGLDRLAVLSLLITGRAQLDQEGALAFAGSQLSAPITEFIEQQLEKALNLGLQFNAEVSTTAVKVTASKEFTRRLVVEGSYQRSFDQAGTVTTTARALLYLFDRAFLEAATSQSRPSVVTPGQPVAGEARATRVELKYQILGR